MELLAVRLEARGRVKGEKGNGGCDGADSEQGEQLTHTDMLLVAFVMACTATMVIWATWGDR